MSMIYSNIQKDKRDRTMLSASPIPQIVAILKKIEPQLKGTKLSDSEISEHLRTLNQIHRMIESIRKTDPHHKGLKSASLETETLWTIALSRNNELTVVALKSRKEIQNGLMARFYSRNSVQDRQLLLSVIDDYNLEVPEGNRTESLRQGCVNTEERAAKYLNGILRHKTRQGTVDCIQSLLDDDGLSRQTLIDCVASITEQRHIIWEAEAFLCRELNDNDIYPDDLRFVLYDTENSIDTTLERGVQYVSDALNLIHPDFKNYCDELISSGSIIENNSDKQLRSVTSKEGTLIISPTSNQYTWLESLGKSLLSGFLMQHLNYQPINDADTFEAFTQFISRACIRHKSMSENNLSMQKAASVRELKEAVFMTLYASRNAQIESEVYNKYAINGYIQTEDLATFTERANAYWFRSGHAINNGWVGMQSLFTPNRPSLYKRTMCYLLSQKLVNDAVSSKTDKQRNNNMIDSLSSINLAIEHIAGKVNQNSIWLSCHDVLTQKISRSIFTLME